MKAGRTTIEVGTKIKVLSIQSSDPDDAVGVVGFVGEITHPFGDLPHTLAGVWPESASSKERIGLCRGDQIQLVESGDVVTL
jgi:hypothetical protein